MAQLKRVVEEAKAAGERSKRILPEFARGNYFADYFKPNGLIPGIFDRKDDLLAWLSRGEMVLNPQQQQRIRASAGFDVFAGAGIPNYAPSPSASQTKPRFATGATISGGLVAAPPPIIMQPQFTLIAEDVTFGDKARVWLESDEGVRTQIKIQKKLKTRGDRV